MRSASTSDVRIHPLTGRAAFKTHCKRKAYSTKDPQAMEKWCDFPEFAVGPKSKTKSWGNAKFHPDGHMTMTAQIDAICWDAVQRAREAPTVFAVCVPPPGAAALPSYRAYHITRIAYRRMAGAGAGGVAAPATFFMSVE